MDPNVALKEAAELAESILKDSEGPETWPTRIDPEDAVALAQMVVDLNDWIQKGGFPPTKSNDVPPLQMFKRNMVFVADSYYPEPFPHCVGDSFETLKKAKNYTAKKEYDYMVIFDRVDGIIYNRDD